MAKYLIGGLVIGIIIAIIIVYVQRQNQNKKNIASGKCFSDCYKVDKKPFDECANKCKVLLN